MTAANNSRGTATSAIWDVTYFACRDIGPITPPGINQAPTANAGADQTVEVGERVELNGLGSTDPDGNPLTYNWEQRSGPNVTLDDPNSTQARGLSAG